MHEGSTFSGDDDSAAVRQALDELLAWEPLRRSPQLGAFLAYVVEARLAGDAGAIKAYSIAVDVFGRAADFDPQRDPIVRVQARRLRALLAEFYQSGRAEAPIEIVLPIGGYVPEFRPRMPEQLPPEQQPVAPIYQDGARAKQSDKPQTEAGQPRAVWAVGILALAILILAGIYWTSLSERTGVAVPVAQPAKPLVIVEEFESLIDDRRGVPLVAGLAIELVTDLNQFPDLSARYGGTQAEVTEGDLARGQPIYMLSGVVRRTEQGVRYSVLLREHNSDAAFASLDVAVPMDNGNPQMSLDDVARMIAIRLGSPRGPLHAATRQWLASSTESDLVLEPYPCFIAAALFREQRLLIDATQVERCAEAGARSGDSESQALLALITADRGWRIGSDSEEGAALLAEGRRLADEAIRIEPISAFNWASRGFVALIGGDPLQAREYYSTAMQLNPAAVDMLADYAYVEAQIGNWQLANSLSALAFSVESDPPNFYYSVPALHALREGDYRAAVEFGARMIEGLPDLGSAVLVSAGGHLRDNTVINAYLPRLLASNRFRRMGIMPALRYHILDRELLRVLSNGISHAGVPVDRLARPF